MSWASRRPRTGAPAGVLPAPRRRILASCCAEGSWGRWRSHWPCWPPWRAAARPSPRRPWRPAASCPRTSRPAPTSTRPARSSRIAPSGSPACRGSELVTPVPVRIECVDGRQLRYNELAWGFVSEPMTLTPEDDPSKAPEDAVNECITPNPGGPAEQLGVATGRCRGCPWWAAAGRCSARRPPGTAASPGTRTPRTPGPGDRRGPGSAAPRPRPAACPAPAAAS